MVWHRLVVVMCALIVVMQGSAGAQLLPGLPQYGQPIGSTQEFIQETGSYYSLGFRKFMSSFTSYQFPNPFADHTHPLSRLEFPVDQWFAGLRSGYRARGWSVDSQAWINANRESRAMMQDSDWDDDNMPAQKTIFSESKCRLNKGIIFDIAARLSIPLEVLTSIGDIAGVAGWRYEYFYFTTHDGEQKVFDGISDPLPLVGDGIDFTQNFYHVYFGVNGRGTFDPSRFSSMLPQMSLEIQVDYAFVNAKNEDLHLLREGNRITTENTRGHCWHGFVSAQFLTLWDMRTVVQFDFQRSLTHGDHRLTNSLFNLDFSFDGSRVWSDLASISVTGEFKF
jgi:hypothetical protein